MNTKGTQIEHCCVGQVYCHNGRWTGSGGSGGLNSVPIAVESIELGGGEGNFLWYDFHRVALPYAREKNMHGRCSFKAPADGWQQLGLLASLFVTVVV